MTVFEFKSNLDKSNNDSLLVINYLKTKDYTIQDCSDNIDIQNKGIDFIIKNKKNNKISKIEFKSCNQIHKTNNIAYEIISNLENKKLGTCITSQADYVFYYDNVKHIVHCFNLKKLNVAISKSNITKWNVAKANTKVKDGVFYCSISLLVPIEFLKKNKKEVEYYSFEISMQG
jgi:hypothetical protein